MTITSAIVLFASIWAVVFFMVLPQGVVSQHESGDVVPGTPASAPTDAQIRRKLLWTTGLTVVAFAVIFGLIVGDVLSLDALDWEFLTPPSAR